MLYSKEKSVGERPDQHAQPLASWADSSKPGGQWKRPRMNRPQRDEIVAITRDLVECYHPDGFSLDVFGNRCVCLCRYCKPALERLFGTSQIASEVVCANWA